ncbi:hypothetical protein LTR53_009697 [Teratosphaeriaceae sp. CCFEE 6253]|nr:hypothetical protein LTR53_009697 [Teratosphaeriaceae sp. CCFEE 6253]
MASNISPPQASATLKTGWLVDPEERRALYAALDSFRQYRQAAHYNTTHLRRLSFYSLPSAHMDILCEPSFSLPETFDAVDQAIAANADIAEAILASGLEMYREHIDGDAWKGAANPRDVDKARSTIRQLYRDWSREGLPERHASHSPIFSALAAHLPACPVRERDRFRILLPGAGLGRLVFDLGEAGYTVEGNELSYHQLIAANYMFSSTLSKGHHRLYPWALAFNNHLSRASQLQSVEIPDVLPRPAAATEVNEKLRQVPCHARTSMVAGDFCEVYKKPEQQDKFDAVATCFFIDTAPSVISYTETIKHCLKPDGLWINIGPLLWHHEPAPTTAEKERQSSRQGSPAASRRARPDASTVPTGSFELSDDEVVALVQRLGFQMVEHRQMPAGATGYIQDPASMLQNVYRPSFWVARKR